MSHVVQTVQIMKTLRVMMKLFEIAEQRNRIDRIG